MVSLFLIFYTLVAHLVLTGAGYTQFKRDLLPASPPSLANDVSLRKNNASPHFSGLDSLALLLRQESECPAGYPIQCKNLGCCSDSAPVCCSGSGCCEEGTFCCGPDASDNCCPTDSVCYPNDKCCPDGSVTCNKGFCADVGSICCGDGVCNAGAECMTSEDGTSTCCSSGQTACNDGNCCNEGTECSLKVGYCQSISTPTSIATETSGSSSNTPTALATMTSTSAESTPKISTPSLPSTSSSSSSTSSSCTFTSAETSFTCTPTAAKAKRLPEATNLASFMELHSRQDSGDDYLQYCNLCEQQIPVMIFPYIPGETEELIASTCEGIGGGNQILLHWAGDGKNKDRRGESGCEGYCQGIGESYNTVYRDRNECDEFPPASSLEGGEHDGVQPHKSCIFWRQNQLGGSLFRSYSSSAHFNLQPGQPYIIRVVPGCTGITKRSPLPHQLDNFNTVQARQATTQLAQFNSSWIQDPTPGVQNGTGYILVPIAGAQAGEYNLKLGLTGFVQQVAITDGDGTQYAFDTAPLNNAAYSFSVGGLTDLSVAAYVNQSANVTVSYSATVTLATQTATASPTSSTQKSESTRVVVFGGLMVGKMMLWGLVFFLGLSFVL